MSAIHDIGTILGRHHVRGAARPAHFVADVWVLTKRSLARIKNEPETLADVTIQPVIFVLLFTYVFGGAIGVPGGGSYH